MITRTAIHTTVFESAMDIASATTAAASSPLLLLLLLLKAAAAVDTPTQMLKC